MHFLILTITNESIFLMNSVSLYILDYFI